MATYRIYSLSDPRDGLARYVGRTCNPVEVRFKQHWADGRKHPTLGRWFADLKKHGLMPIRAVVQEHDHPLAEEAWISRMIAAGHPLLNAKFLYRMRIHPIYPALTEVDVAYNIYIEAEWPEFVDKPHCIWRPRYYKPKVNPDHWWEKHKYRCELGAMACFI